MVDVIKSVPVAAGLSSRTTFQSESRPSLKQISLPILVSNVGTISHNDRRWIGRCPGDSLNTSSGVYRKVMYRELARRYPPTIVDAFPSLKHKQQEKNNTKELLKGTQTTTVTSLPMLSGVASQNFHLFNALSKHITIKAEPLRPANDFISNSKRIATSWQKYWASSLTQRQRGELNDSESISYHITLDHQPKLATTHFVTIHSSSFCTSTENNDYDKKLSTVSNSSSSTEFSFPIGPDEQSDFLKEENHSSPSPFVSPSVINSPPIDITPMHVSKLIAEKPSTLIKNEQSQINNELNTITTKLYKLPLPSNRLKVNKSITKRRTRSKSSEKKAIKLSTLPKKNETRSLPSTSVSKTRHPPSSNKSYGTNIKKPQSLSTTLTTTARSKYERSNWDEPYVGIRVDPPTPACTPSSAISLDRNNHNQNHTL